MIQLISELKAFNLFQEREGMGQMFLYLKLFFSEMISKKAQVRCPYTKNHKQWLWKMSRISKKQFFNFKEIVLLMLQVDTEKK